MATSYVAFPAFDTIPRHVASGKTRSCSASLACSVLCEGNQLFPRRWLLAQAARLEVAIAVHRRPPGFALAFAFALASH